MTKTVSPAEKCPTTQLLTSISGDYTTLGRSGHRGGGLFGLTAKRHTGSAVRHRRPTTTPLACAAGQAVRRIALFHHQARAVPIRHLLWCPFHTHMQSRCRAPRQRPQLPARRAKVPPSAARFQSCWPCRQVWYTPPSRSPAAAVYCPSKAEAFMMIDTLFVGGGWAASCNTSHHHVIEQPQSLQHPLLSPRFSPPVYLCEPTCRAH